MRLIDADKLKFIRIRIFHGMNPDGTPCVGGWNAALLSCAIDDAPTVDAVILPCKIGDDVYIIPSKVNFRLNVLNRHEENNRIYHQKVDSITFTKQGWHVLGDADHEYGTGRILPDRFYKETWFLTREEAEAALTKMKGGAPTVDAVPVVRGEWKVLECDGGEPGGYAPYIIAECSNCGLTAEIEQGQYGWAYGDPFPWKGCPFCVAKMDGGNEE